MPDPVIIRSLRDLDALVAEKVMGWRWYRRSNPITGGYWLDSAKRPTDGITGEAMLTSHEDAEELGLSPEPANVSRYTSDPAAAYALRQRMREEGWFYQSACSGETVLAIFSRGGQNGQEGTGLHSSEHIAFCLAALEANGVAYVLETGWDGEAGRA